jgi:chromosome segregation ATPase
MCEINLDISIVIQDPQSLNETQKGSAVDIAAKEEEIGQQTINKDSLDEPARWEKVEHSQILETALDAALEQAADFKSKLDAAVELSDRCTQENDLMRRRIEECKEDLDATLEQSRLADDKQREQADSLQRMNVTIETLQQSCNMWEMISVQMTERAENAERKVDEQHAFMLSMSKVVDKLEKSCLWWEALAGEMKDTADVAESHLFDVEKRIESMDDAYRSVWEDRLRWKESLLRLKMK